MAEMDDVKKDAAIFGKLLAFAIKEKNEENILFYFDKGNMAALFPKYIKTGAPKEINIDSKLRDKLENAFNAKKEPDFMKAVVDAKNVCHGLAVDIWRRYQLTAEYKFIIARRAAEKNAAKAMKVLGISAGGKDLLLDAIAYGKIKNNAEALKKLDELAKKEKLKAKNDQILKNLAASGLI
jgi:hypothetical protein